MKTPKTIFKKLFPAAELISSLLDKGQHWNSLLKTHKKHLEQTLLLLSASLALRTNVNMQKTTIACSIINISGITQCSFSYNKATLQETSFVFQDKAMITQNTIASKCPAYILEILSKLVSQPILNDPVKSGDVLYLGPSLQYLQDKIMFFKKQNKTRKTLTSEGPLSENDSFFTGNISTDFIFSLSA